MDELVSKLSYCSIVGTPNPNDGITHALDTLDNCDVEKAVLEACRETAFSFRSSVADRSNRTMLIGLLRAKEDKPLLVDRVKQVLNADPRLGVCRFDLAGTGVPDGFTPLHVLASNGNIYLLKIFLEIGVQKSGINGKSVISPWTVDLQGK